MSIDEVIEKIDVCALGGYGVLVTLAALGIALGWEIHGAVEACRRGVRTGLWSRPWCVRALFPRTI